MELGARIGTMAVNEGGGGIKTFAEFYDAIVNHPTEEHILGADITLNDWVPCSFSGILHGNGHKLLGLTDSLFSSIDGSVDGLTLRGNNTTIYVTPDADFGVLATTATGATIENCVVSGFKLISQQVTRTIYPGMGFFVGRAYDGCTFTGCTTADDCSAVLGVNTFCGGIVGCANQTGTYTDTELVTFLRCINNSDCSSSVAVSAVGNGAFGGILGAYNKTTSSATKTVHIEQCKNNGDLTLSADDVSTAHTFGGIVGKYEGYSSGYPTANSLYVSSCENNGSYRKPIGSSKNAVFGGIVGLAKTCPDFKIDRCVNNGNAVATGSTSTTNCCFGGIFGRVYQGAKLSVKRISNSINRGSIDLVGSCYGCGGIFGYFQFGSTMLYGASEVYVENCSCEGSIRANNKAQIAYVASAYQGSKFFVDNCWVAESEAVPRVNSASGVVITETNVKAHIAGNDAAECAALDAVAATVEEYLPWEINATTTHPEPVIS